MWAKLKRRLVRLRTTDYRKIIPASAVALIITAVAVEVASPAFNSSKEDSPFAAENKWSISKKCKDDVTCIWDSIDAPSLCREYFSTIHRHPKKWITDKKLNFHAHYQAETDVVTYESDDLLMEGDDGLFTLTTKLS